MSQSIQIRRGTSAQADALTLLEGELYIDMTLKQLRIHDEVTPGGNKVAMLNAPPRVTLPSAATVSIGTANAETVIVNGSTTITSLGASTDGVRRTVMFTGVLTLTHNGTSLILPGAVDIVTAPGDVAEFINVGGSNWKCLLFTAAAGTVRGSNANGDYVKYPDGRLECSLNVASVSIAVTTAYSPLFYGQPALWTFPIPFVGAMPYVALTPYSVGKLAWGTRSASVSLASAQFAILDIASATATYQLSYIAIGRWK
ncbi:MULTISPECIES: hyaluronate lyase N-terminal domain-containing protein [unclassified Pseudomonas]|uniref:Major tropism determinant N-terminal domain-containing protein n=1 Tax=Pseudomonas sp. MYb327 TaxID=2745230 RepID=A0AAU8E6K3_9PSED